MYWAVRKAIVSNLCHNVLGSKEHPGEWTHIKMDRRTVVSGQGVVNHIGLGIKEGSDEWSVMHYTGQ